MESLVILSAKQKTLASNYTILRPFGTDGWLAPEVLNGSPHYTYQGDIFPLGLIFCFTLSGGRHPFGEDVRDRNARIQKGEQMQQEIRLIFKKTQRRFSRIDREDAQSKSGGEADCCGSSTTLLHW